MPLVIHLLGPFRAIIDGVPVDEQRWGRRKSKTLVKLLALQPRRQGSRQMHREELIELLWPGLDAEQGLNNLHKALHAARRALEPGLPAGAASRFLQMRDQLVLLQSQDEIVVDVADFEARAEAAGKSRNRQELDAALAIYQADLLPEDLYEDWAALRREQLLSLREQLLLQLATVCEAAGDAEHAIDACKQLTATNSCNEAAHRGLMRLYSASGHRHLAVEQFRICREAMRAELAVDPEPATVHLYEQILARTGKLTAVEAGASIVAPAAPLEPAPLPIVPPKAAQRKLAYWVATVTVVSLIALAFVGLPSKAPGVQFVAIMPLATAKDSPELDYVADGITESVINNLSRLPQVRVMARSTVYRYRAKGLDPMAAGAEMKVRAILTGMISRRGEKLLVAAELVAVADGTRLWGSQYELTAKDLISVQDRIASEIAAGLRLRLSADDRAHLSRPDTADPEAYRLYLQARFFWNKRSREGFLKSIDLFRAALEHDPSYARAYAGLADSYGLLGRDDAPTNEYLPKARAAARRALEIDERLAEAHTSLGMIDAVYEWNFKAAEQEFQRALEIDPSYATAHHWYGVYLASQGEYHLAQSQLDQAAEIDPLSPIIALAHGYPASFQGRLDEAIRAARKALEISPGFPAALEDLMMYFERQGRQDAAIEQAVALLQARAQTELAETVQATYQRAGYQAALRTWTDAEEARAAKTYVSPMRIAILATRAGEIDKAFGWLAQAVDGRNAALVYLNVDPKYAPLRSDPRFASVLRRIGLGEAAANRISIR